MAWPRDARQPDLRERLAEGLEPHARACAKYRDGRELTDAPASGFARLIAGLEGGDPIELDGVSLFCLLHEELVPCDARRWRVDADGGEPESIDLTKGIKRARSALAEICAQVADARAKGDRVEAERLIGGVSEFFESWRTGALVAALRAKKKAEAGDDERTTLAARHDVDVAKMFAVEVLERIWELELTGETDS